MRKSLNITAAVLFSAAVFLLIISCAKEQSGDLLTQIKHKKEITVATEGTWAPWTYHDENEHLVGFDVEVAQKVAEKLGVKANVIEVEWDGIFAGIDSKRYDTAFNGIEITDERSKKYDFSEPYCYIHTALIVKSDNDTIKSFEDLKGKKTANTLASTYTLLAESYGATTVGVDDLNQTFELVKAGRVDATLNADVSYYDYIKAHPDAGLKIVAVTQDASSVSVPVRKDSSTKTLLVEINKAIEELRESGELRAISTKYFGSDISNKQ